MGLGRAAKRVAGGAAGGAAGGGAARRGKTSYEDVEGLTVSLGVLFALLLPGSMVLQNSAFDEGVQTKNFLLALCTQKSFRNYVVESLDRDGFSWNVTLGRGDYLDTKAVLQAGSNWWEWDGGHPESLYPCGTKKELAAAARVTYEAFPKSQFDAWALMHHQAPLWSDHLNAMTSFAMSIFMGGLIGSLAIYISLSLSSAREDETGAALEGWHTVGFPLLAWNLCVLITGIIVLLFANDAYSESQDTFFLRSQRFGNYAKIGLLAIFVPLVVFFFTGSIWSLVRSCRRSGAGGPPAAADPH